MILHKIRELRSLSGWAKLWLSPTLLLVTLCSVKAVRRDHQAEQDEVSPLYSSMAIYRHELSARIVFHRNIQRSFHGAHSIHSQLS
jgi:hypothetical protein